MLPNAQRTAYFEKRIDDAAKPNVFDITFEYTSYAYYPVLRDEDARPLPATPLGPGSRISTGPSAGRLSMPVTQALVWGLGVATPRFTERRTAISAAS